MKNKIKDAWDVIKGLLIVAAVIGYTIWAFKDVQAYKVIIFAAACIYFGFEVGYFTCEENNKKK